MMTEAEENALIAKVMDAEERIKRLTAALGKLTNVVGKNIAEIKRLGYEMEHVKENISHLGNSAERIIEIEEQHANLIAQLAKGLEVVASR